MNTYLDKFQPGIEARREADAARRAELDRISREIVAPAQEALAALCYSSRNADGTRRKQPSVTTAAFDAAEADLVAARAAYDAQLAIVRAGDPTPLAQIGSADVEKAAATEALKQHELAIAAQRAASNAFALRDAAWARAGRPGIAWTTRSDLGARSTEVGGGVMTLDSVTRARVDGFDVRATQLVADGNAAASIPARVAVGPDAGADQSMSYHAGPAY